MNLGVLTSFLLMNRYHELNYSFQELSIHYCFLKNTTTALQGCRMHAFISEKLSDAFGEDLQEGQIYTLSNFKVTEYSGEETNRAVRNTKHIYFDSQTKFERITNEVPLMKQYALDLFGLKDLPQFLVHNHFLIGTFVILIKK